MPNATKEEILVKKLHTMTLLILTFSQYAVCQVDQSVLPAPYNSVELLPFDGTAHFGDRQKRGLLHVIQRYRPKSVVEIGSYLGASTRFIAQLLDDDGVVYAVDHWLGNDEWTHQQNYQEIQSLFYQKFLSNVIHAGLCHKIIPMKMTSVDASCTLEVVPDLIFIDGSHDYHSVYEDLTAWYPHVRGHGVLCGDDYNWGNNKPVKQAVDRFARENGLSVHIIADWFWYYEKK